MAATPSPIQDASTTTIAAVIVLLERRERNAQAAYGDICDQLDAVDECGNPLISTAGRNTWATAEKYRCTGRLAEAQEALATVRALAASPLP